MAVFAYDKMGAVIHAPAEAEMAALLDSLSAEDIEHQDVSLNDEQGWSLSVFPGGLIVFENVETGEGPWHMQSVTREKILEHWKDLAAGNHQKLLSLPWVAGYGA
ncbi:MAG: hypothetical protein LBE32_03780 [Burkholderiales bacterium]|jgi:hypothetical protein|nr:hypothetical protein [Burkholderiales bacterium]